MLECIDAWVKEERMDIKRQEDRTSEYFVSDILAPISHYAE